MSVCKILGLGSALILIGGCQSWQFQGVEELPPPEAVPETSEPGEVQVRYYDNLDGVEIDTMTASAKFPDNPDEVASLTSLEDPENRAEYYGSYVRGFIKPPASGEYRFFISGNDQAEFWLSTSDSPENVDLLSLTPAWTNVNEFDKYSSQTSRYVTLDSSKRYYFEVLQKEGFGSDHFAVAWEGPGISREVIGSSYIYSYAKPAIDTGQTGQEAYNLGYRVGYVDGTEGLTFNPAFPPADQDQDGLYDNWEVVNGLNPDDSNDASSDPDGDQLAAADEFLIGTSENKSDTDGDGIPDGVEFANELDPLDDTDAQGDLDSDGSSNLEEYIAGTVINDPSSTPTAAPSPEPEPEPEPEPTPTEPSYIAGFGAQYFEGTSFNRFVLTDVHGAVDFDWARGQPLPEMPEDQFSIRWNGIFTAPHESGSNEYRFTVSTNDGVRLYANGQLVIDDWTSHPTRTFTYDRSLSAGEQLKLTIEYFEGSGSAVARYSATNLSTGESLSTASTVSTPDPSTRQGLDSDGDGISDTWELRHGLSVWVPDAGVVNNSQGITNIEAYEASLDPYTLETVAPEGDSTTSGGTGDTSTTPSEPTTSEPTSPDSGSVTLTWTAPLTRLDGSSIALSEIASYTIDYGQDVNSLQQSVNIGGDQTSYTFDGLASGTWYFTIKVLDTNGLSSPPSSPVSTQVQ
ncbi:PA14 domain-containing protein [Marinobacter sp.]|uniref:PA14 domain-containing protein n=1 Tax=Marinobacter sp. TaxID=50741 RepID=UPI00235433EC|nr:PA14 domain-containing protein [Marinobacter sp.]